MIFLVFYSASLQIDVSVKTDPHIGLSYFILAKTSALVLMSCDSNVDYP